MDRKKILILLPFIPYPLNTGGCQAAFHMINYIKDYFDVHLWFHVNNTKKTRMVINDLCNALNRQVYIHVTQNHIGQNYITFRAIRRFLEAKILKRDLQYQHNSKIWGEGVSGYADFQALEDINNIIIENRINIIQVEFTMLLDIVYALPRDIKKVFIHHELGFARQDTLMKQLDFISSYDNYRFNKNKAEEIEALNHYDHIITLTDVDKKKLECEGVISPISSSPAFIPQPAYPNFSVAKDRLTYVASGGHYPNVEGLEWFIKKVHPLLKNKMPNYRLDICGPKWNLSNISFDVPSNVRFMGFVENLCAVIPGSLMIVPILSGSGMRMKILESINNAVPFVSTVVGAEGLDFKTGRDCIITDSPEEFADSIVNILCDENIQKSFVKNARKLYEEKYSPEIQAKKRLKILQNI